ncbi:MAG: ABC transporter permease [Pirellulales bacterium]
MYKLLLCWRYLRTRYIALASIISVTLGVATMIVVNSVMQGFTVEMRDKIHGILSDLEFRSHSMSGFADPEGVMAKIRQTAGDDIESMTPTVQVPAMLTYQYGGQNVLRQVQIVGIDPQTQSATSDFGKYLLHPVNRDDFNFELREDGWDSRTSEDIEEGRIGSRPELAMGGWNYRRRKAQNHRRYRESTQPPPDEVPAAAGPIDPFAARQEEPEAVFDPERDQHSGIVMGIALANYRTVDKEEHFLLLPGDDVQLTFPSAGTPPKAVDDLFTIVDFYESKMSEYDSNLVFVPLRKLQELRGMIEPSTGMTYVSSIQIKLKPGVDGDEVANKIRRVFPAEVYACNTWQEKQGPLLAAVQMETAILNLLLFMIIAVAGFGILAIFFMIVVEKTRDIGVLKSLGASGRGIQGIFLTYGLSLGVVGSGAGMALGLLFVAYINNIANFLSWCTGHEVFDPSIYYFSKIPTVVQPFTVGWVVVGAMLIAVLASILPARRAARLHPVEALRYE